MFRNAQEEGEEEEEEEEEEADADKPATVNGVSPSKVKEESEAVRRQKELI